MNTGTIILYGFGSVIIGIVIGLIASNVISRIEDIKLKKNAKKFSEGNLKNQYKHAGSTYDVNKFIIRNELQNGKHEEVKLDIQA